MTHSSSVCDLHGHFILTLWLWCHSSAQEVAWTRSTSLLKVEELNTEFTCITPVPWGDTDAHFERLHRLPPTCLHSPLTLLHISCWYRAKDNLLEGRDPCLSGSAPHEVCQPCSPLLLLSVLSLISHQHVQLTRSAAHCAWKDICKY